MGAYLAVAGQIKASGEILKQQQKYIDENTNLVSFVEAFVKYAYRPFSEDTGNRVNTLLPNMYYYIHPFLKEAKSKGDDVAIFGTWVMSIFLIYLHST